MYVVNQTPLFTGAMSALPYSEALADKFLRVDKFGGEFNLAFVNGANLMVPRNTAPMGKIDYRTRVKLPLAIDCKKPPRTQEQADLIKKSLTLLRGGQNHIFDAPTGFGKSYCGCAIAAALGQKTLIIVPKDDLIHEWLKTLRDLIGVPVDKIGIIQADQCDYIGKWFVIGMVKSLSIPDRYDHDLTKAFGLVIWDEVHRMGADTFSETTKMFPAQYRLGMSATTERSDGRDEIFRANIGPVMVQGVTVPMKPKILVKRTAFKMGPVWYKDEHDQWVKGSKQPSGNRMMGVYRDMAEDTARNKIIVGLVMQAYHKHRNILMVSDLMDHLNTISGMLIAAGFPPQELATYTSKTPASEKTRAKEKARGVLATFGMVKEGTDAPNWDTLIMMTPHANIVQVTGRVIRMREGKPTPIVFDLLDQDMIFRGYYQARARQYLSPKIGGTIVMVK